MIKKIISTLIIFIALPVSSFAENNEWANDARVFSDGFKQEIKEFREQAVKELLNMKVRMSDASMEKKKEIAKEIELYKIKMEKDIVNIKERESGEKYRSKNNVVIKKGNDEIINNVVPIKKKVKKEVRKVLKEEIKKISPHKQIREEKDKLKEEIREFKKNFKGDKEEKAKKLKEYRKLFLETRLKNIIKKYTFYIKKTELINERLKVRIDRLKKKDIDSEDLEKLYNDNQKLFEKLNTNFNSAKSKIETMLNGDLEKETIKSALKEIKNDLKETKQGIRSYFKSIRTLIKELRKSIPKGNSEKKTDIKKNKN